MTAREFADRLHARGVGKGKWIARCSHHDDRHPSLSIREGKKCILVKCMSAGCDTQDVLRAMGLQWGDLFYDDKPFIPATPQPPQPWSIAGPVWFDTAEDARAMALACAALLSVPEAQRGVCSTWNKANGRIPDPHALITGEWDVRAPDGYVVHPAMRTPVLEAEMERALQSWWRLRTWAWRSARWQTMNCTKRDRVVEEAWKNLQSRCA